MERKEKLRLRVISILICKLTRSQMKIKMQIWFAFSHTLQYLHKQTPLSIFILGLICSSNCVFLEQLKWVNTS